MLCLQWPGPQPLLVPMAVAFANVGFSKMLVGTAFRLPLEASWSQQQFQQQHTLSLHDAPAHALPTVCRGISMQITEAHFHANDVHPSTGFSPWKWWSMALSTQTCIPLMQESSPHQQRTAGCSRRHSLPQGVQGRDPYLLLCYTGSIFPSTAY